MDGLDRVADVRPIGRADAWGPFTPGISPCELRVRLAILRTLVFVLCPNHQLRLLLALRTAESGDADVLALALGEMDSLPTLMKRRVLASYAALARP